MSLKEIKKTIDSGGEITFWSFPMVHEGNIRHTTFYTVLLEDNDGVQWVSFTYNEIEAEYLCRYNEYDGADLSMTFEEFARGVDELTETGRSVLNGTTEGILQVIGKDTVQYTTACGMKFRLSIETLQALAS